MGGLDDTMAARGVLLSPARVRAVTSLQGRFGSSRRSHTGSAPTLLSQFLSVGVLPNPLPLPRFTLFVSPQSPRPPFGHSHHPFSRLPGAHSTGRELLHASRQAPKFLPPRACCETRPSASLSLSCPPSPPFCRLTRPSASVSSALPVLPCASPSLTPSMPTRCSRVFLMALDRCVMQP